MGAVKVNRLPLYTGQESPTYECATLPTYMGKESILYHAILYGNPFFWYIFSHFFAYVAHFVFERCLDSNPESCRSNQTRYQLSNPNYHIMYSTDGGKINRFHSILFFSTYHES